MKAEKALTAATLVASGGLTVMHNGSCDVSVRKCIIFLRVSETQKLKRTQK